MSEAESENDTLYYRLAVTREQMYERATPRIVRKYVTMKGEKICREITLQQKEVEKRTVVVTSILKESKWPSRPINAREVRFTKIISAKDIC